MSFGPNKERVNRLVTGRDIIKSCSCPRCCTECTHYCDISEVSSASGYRRVCMHPHDRGKSLDGIPVDEERPKWCPYHSSVVRCQHG